MPRNAFTHQPLQDAGQQIRLLRFVDQAERGTIICELTAVIVSSCPQYAAISYTWGSPQGSCSITINGKSFEVGQNCHYALAQIAPHLQDNLRYFWLDSICINQTDLDEKALQVEMMGDIYIRAETVFSCVGPHADDSEIVLPMVKEMATWIRSQPPENRYKQTIAMDGLHELQSAGEKHDIEFGRKSTAAYIALGNREYWRRMWIVQEARLAKGCLIFCGPDTIQLADFATFLRAFMNDRAADKDFWLETWLLTDMWRVISGSSHLPRRAEANGNIRPLALSKALERFDKHEASNFRDRLYALAKIAEWPDGVAPPKPDYRVSKLALMREVLQRLSGVDWAEHRCCTAIARLTAAFGLTTHAPEMRGLIHQREGARQAQVPVSETPQLPILYAGQYLRRPSGCHIRLALNGNLSANIGNYIKGRELFEGEKTRVFTSKIGRPLYVDGEVAGFLCPQTQPGDVLLQVDDGNGIPVWLVIRPLTSNSTEKNDEDIKFEILGPGLANPGFQVQSSERSGYTDMYDHSGIPQDQRDLPSVFDLWFDQEDFLIWRSWVYSFEKGILEKQEVEGFLGGKGVRMERSWAVLREKGVDWLDD